MIHPNALEQGGVYLGIDGRVREIVEISGRLLTFRLLAPGCKIGAAQFHQSRPEYTDKGQFGHWAQKELA
jgi:hypothetical protein